MNTQALQTPDEGTRGVVLKMADWLQRPTGVDDWPVQAADHPDVMPVLHGSVLHALGFSARRLRPPASTIEVLRGGISYGVALEGRPTIASLCREMVREHVAAPVLIQVAA